MNKLMLFTEEDLRHRPDQTVYKLNRMVQMLNQLSKDK